MGSLPTAAPPVTDSSVYDIHHQTFTSAGLPSDADAWIQRAVHVAEILAQDVSIRDKENKSPFAEVSLLKSSGLTKVMGPSEYGGGRQTWEMAYKIIREIAKVDGSIGILLGYHLLWSTTANVVGTDEQKERTQKLIIENNYFVGGAVNPRDNDQKITDDGDAIIFSGFKHFNTGGVVSDLTVLEGVYEGTDQHIFALAPSKQAAIQFAHNWDNIGLRLTESGSVKIDGVRVPWTDALGWDPKTKAPIESVLTIPWASLLLPTYIHLPYQQNFKLMAKQYSISLFQFLSWHFRWRFDLCFEIHRKKHPCLALWWRQQRSRSRRVLYP